MNRIVREHFPVADLPEALREGFELDTKVRVIIEPDVASPPRPEQVMTLEEMFSFAKTHPSSRTMDEIVADIRSQRDEWND